MESDNGRLNFSSGIDNSQMKQNAEETKDILRNIGSSAEESGRTGDEAFKRMADSAQASARKMSDSIQVSQSTVKDAVHGAVSASEKEMDNLRQAFQRGYNFDGPVSDIKKSVQVQIDYLKDLEKQYKQTQAAIGKLSPGNERGKLEKDLAAQKRVIEEEKAALDGMKQKYDEISSNTFPSFRTQIMQITNQMAQMRLEGKNNTEEYKKLETELGKLATIQREVRNNMTSDSTGATQWTGIIQGVQGLMGAYSVGSGIIGMFTKDQEKLMKMQTKMQSVMGILMGMQTIANTLHSTSTFRLRTLTKAQELYTLALNKTKVALLSGSAAAKTFKLALASTGVGLLLVALGALVSAISKMKQRAKEATKETEAFKKSLDITYAGTGQVAKATTEINNYITALEKSNLTKAQEKKLIDDLNSKYGGLLGKYQTKAEWLEVLKTKTADYINMLRLQAQAEAATKQAMEAADKEEEAQKKVEEVKAKNQPLIDKNKQDYYYFIDNGNSQLAANLARQNEKLQQEIDDANKELEEAVKNREEAFAKFGEVSSDLQEQSLTMPGATQATVEALRKQMDEIDKIRQNGLKSINANEIALMQEGKDKKLAEIEKEREDMLSALDKERKELDKKLKDAGTGGLSKQDEANFTIRTTQINTIQDNKRAEVEKQYNEEIARMYRELGDVFATEEQKKMSAIKRRYEEQRKQLQKQKEGGYISEELYIDLSANVDKAEAKETFDYWLTEYGTYDQKRKALDDEWRARLKDVPPEFAAEAQKQMTEALSKLDFEQFKNTIDWSGIFGDLGNQSTQALQYNLQQVQTYFENNKLNLGIDEIKDLQEAIKSMTDELEGRNPFAGLLNSIKGISAAKAEAVAAIEEIRQANEELNAAKAEERLAEQEFLEYSAMVETADDPDAMEAKIAAEERLAEAKIAVAAAENKKATADKKGVQVSNSMATATKKFTTNLQSTKVVVSGVANDAKNLASVFSDDVADGIGQAIDLFDTVIDAATDVIDTIANTGKQVGESITSTVQASSTAMQATSTAAATSIQTVEKASVILTVISAALQVATAIASLFGNGDEQKQKEIESLQKRIDQLQWELDNAAIIRVQGGEGAESVVDEIKQKYIDAAGEIQRAWKGTVGAYLDKQGFFWDEKKFFKGLEKATEEFKGERVKIVAQSLAKDFSNIKYSADKVFGDAYWNQAANNAEKYTEQMVLMEQQLAAEKSKKKTDEDKVKEYEQGIAELKQKMIDEFNDVVEEIIGGSAEDIAEQLGDAFFEAFQAGEDAAEAWGQAVDKIVADVIKRMFIQQFLTKNIADIFDKYKEKWFSNGKFIGWDAFQETVGDFGSELKDAANFAVEAFEHMPEDVKEIFTSSAREASEKGLASMSQDSADEMNGRLTAIQSHTYMINESVKLIVSISNSILISVLDIQENTERINTYLAGLAGETRQLRASVESIQNRGLQLR